MAKMKRDDLETRRHWRPTGEQLGASLVSAAITALETHGGRPAIRRVSDDVEVIDMTISMFEHLEASDFPDLDQLIFSHEPPDPEAGVPDTRGISLQLLRSALEFKGRLKAFHRSDPSVDLDDLLWSLSHAEAVRGELRNASSEEFARNRLQWLRTPGQAKGRETKTERMKVRNDQIRAMADEFREKQSKRGRPEPSLAQIARHIRRRLDEQPASGDRQLSEKSIIDIIQGRR